MTSAHQQLPKVPHSRLRVVVPISHVQKLLETSSAFARTFPNAKFIHHIPVICDETAEVTVDVTTCGTTAGEIANCLQLFLQAQNSAQSLGLEIGSIQYLGGTEV